MFDFTHRHRKLIQVVLFLIFLPFAFFGVDSYFRGRESSQAVATVGGQEISQQEFARALQERQRALQSMLQGRVDPSLLDNPALRRDALEGLIQQRLLLDTALRSGMMVGDHRLRTAISELPVFQGEGGKFSIERYRQYLKSEGQTEASFEARLRQQMLLQQLSEAYVDSAFVPRTVAERVIRLAEQQREVSQAVLRPEQFASSIKVDAAAAKKYYDANRSEFELPEKIRLEYVLLSLEDLAAKVKVEPAEVAKYYESRRAQFEKSETKARHILIAVDAGAKPDAKAKALALAEDLYGRLGKDPKEFPELAKKYSQDPGSAANGGDLGFITRGSMRDVPEFETALFGLKQGEISRPVETKLGFHIIQAAEVRGVRGKSLDEVRGEIEVELKKQLAARRFAELADKFNNTVYEQSESLKPAAELVGTELRRSDWVTRSGAADALLNNPRLLQAVFADDVLKDKRNSEAIELESGKLVSARLLEHQPASQQTFEQVSAAIEKKLAGREAARRAAEQGREKLALLRQGKEAGLAWSKPQLVSRSDAKDIAASVLRQAFKTPTLKLPAYDGVEEADGTYVILRVTQVTDPKELAADRREAYTEALRRTRGQEEFNALVASARQKAGVTISAELLEKKDR